MFQSVKNHFEFHSTYWTYQKKYLGEAWWSRELSYNSESRVIRVSIHIDCILVWDTPGQDTAKNNTIGIEKKLQTDHIRYMSVDNAII